MNKFFTHLITGGLACITLYGVVRLSFEAGKEYAQLEADYNAMQEAEPLPKRKKGVMGKIFQVLKGKEIKINIE